MFFPQELLTSEITYVVAVLTFGLTEWLKKILPEKLKKFTPLMAMAIGVGLMLWGKQSLLLEDAFTGFVVGFTVTTLYKVADKDK